MTIAIGAKFEHNQIIGALVCADSRVTATDGATTLGSKSHLSMSAGERSRAIAIANSTEDGNAADMLAGDITTALRTSGGDNDPKTIRSVVTEVMTEWYSHYGAVKPPGMEFVVAVGLFGNLELLYCSPPNTVLSDKGDCFAIGSGSRAVDPLILPVQSGIHLPTAEAAILRAAYWIHRAKRDEGAFVGGNAPLYLVSQWGRCAIVNDSNELEAFGEKVDQLISDCRYQILTHESDEKQRTFLTNFQKRYLELANAIREVALPQLRWLESQPRDSRQLNSRMSETAL